MAVVKQPADRAFELRSLKDVTLPLVGGLPLVWDAPSAKVKSSALFPCLVVHADGTHKTYATIPLALAASVSGDTIIVAPGSYTISANLAKNGVNWYFMPGATLTWSAAGNGYFFDDAAGAKSYVVAGHGNFSRTASGFDHTNLGNDDGSASPMGVLRAMNPASVVTFQCNKINILLAETVENFGWTTGLYFDAGATVTLDINEIDCDRTGGAIYNYINAVWWSNGNVNGRIGRIYCPSYDTSVLVMNGFSIVSQATPAGEFRVSCEDVDCLTPINNVSPSTAVGFWLSAKTINGQGVSDGGKTYVTAQKLIGGWVHGGGKFYCDAMKVSGQFDNNLGPHPCFEIQAGTAWINVVAFEPAGGNTQELIKLDGATALLHFNGQDLTAAAAQNAVWVSAGTANLYSGNILTGAGKLDLRRTGGTLNVSANLVYDGAKTAGTITKLKTYGAAPP